MNPVPRCLKRTSFEGRLGSSVEKSPPWNPCIMTKKRLRVDKAEATQHQRSFKIHHTGLHTHNH